MNASQYDPSKSPKFSEATRLLQEKKYPEAIAILEQLARDKPSEGEYWFALGLAQAANNAIPPALSALEKACAATPRPPRSCYHYGRLLQSIGRHEEAVRAFEAGGRGADDSVLLSAKAVSYEAMFQYAEADQAFRAALAESALRPANSAEVQFRYASFLIRQDKYEAALWQLSQMLRKQPFAGSAWRLKATVLITLGRNADAADSLEQAIAHGERNRQNLLMLSKLYAQLGEKDKADSYLREADPSR